MSEQKSYTAENIRILSDAEVFDSFDWAKVGHIASQYGKDIEFIKRGLSACERVGAPPDYFIRRYCQGDKSEPFREDVDAAFREMHLRKSAQQGT